MTTLERIIKEKAKVRIYVSNGVQMRGKIIADEGDYLVCSIMEHSGEVLVYKNQISTIVIS